MAANEVNIKLKADSKDVTSKLKNVQASVRKAGVAMSAIGAIGIIGIKKFVDAALVQDIALRKVVQSAKNAGVSMVGFEEKVLAATAALQKKTNFGDEAQLEVLAQLIPTLGDTETALAALPAVMDVATLLGQDLTSTVKTMAPALAGVTDRIRGTTLAFDKSMGPMERIDLVLGQVGGQAEAAANPLIQFANAVDDVGEKIGAGLLPALIPFVSWGQKLAEKLQTVDKDTMKFVGTITVFGVAALAILGPLALLVTSVGALGAALMFLVANPIGLIITGIGLAVVTTYIAFKKWDVIIDGVKKSLNIFIELINTTAIPFINNLIKAFNAFSPKDIGLIDEIELLDTSIKDVSDTAADLAADLEEEMDEVKKSVVITLEAFEELDKVIKNMTGKTLPPLVLAQIRLGDIIDKVGGKTFDWDDEIDKLVNTGLFNLAEATNEVARRLENEHSEAMRKAAEDVLGFKEETEEAEKAVEELSDSIEALNFDPLTQNLTDVEMAFHRTMQGILDVIDSQRLLDEAIAKRFGRGDQLSGSESQLMGALTGTAGGTFIPTASPGFDALSLINQGDIAGAARKLHGAGMGAEFTGSSGITINVNANTTGTVDDMIIKIKEALAQAGVSGEQTRSS